MKVLIALLGLLAGFQHAYAQHKQHSFAIQQKRQCLFDENGNKLKNGLEFKNRLEKYQLSVHMQVINEDSCVIRLVKNDLGLDSTRGLANSGLGKAYLDTTKYKVLVFWNAYCAPCIKKFPQMDSLYKAIAQDKDLLFTTITSDATAKANATLKKHNASFPVIANGGKYVKNLKVSAVPTVLLYSKDNQLRYVFNYVTYEDIAKLKQGQ
jgi:thiol-disulfide isomerase/thioredoxin